MTAKTMTARKMMARTMMAKMMTARTARAITKTTVLYHKHTYCSKLFYNNNNNGIISILIAVNYFTAQLTTM
jgi:hypothetical protein